MWAAFDIKLQDNDRRVRHFAQKVQQMRLAFRNHFELFQAVCFCCCCFTLLCAGSSHHIQRHMNGLYCYRRQNKFEIFFFHALVIRRNLRILLALSLSYETQCMNYKIRRTFELFLSGSCSSVCLRAAFSMRHIMCYFVLHLLVATATRLTEILILFWMISKILYVCGSIRVARPPHRLCLVRFLFSLLLFPFSRRKLFACAFEFSFHPFHVVYLHEKLTFINIFFLGCRRQGKKLFPWRKSSTQLLAEMFNESKVKI